MCVEQDLAAWEDSCAYETSLEQYEQDVKQGLIEEVDEVFYQKFGKLPEKTMDYLKFTILSALTDECSITEDFFRYTPLDRQHAWAYLTNGKDIYQQKLSQWIFNND